MGQLDLRLRDLIDYIEEAERPLDEWDDAELRRWGLVKRESDRDTVEYWVRAFVKVSEETLDQQRAFGFEPEAVRGNMATGMIRIDHLSGLAELETTVYVYGVRLVRSSLNLSVAEIGASSIQSQYSGSGVIVGIVDSGMDLLHPNFRDSSDQTRALLAAEYVGGTVSEHNSVAIDLEIQELEQNPPARQHLTHRDTKGHGTMVGGIAVGNGRAPADADSGYVGTTFKGVAPEADIISINAMSVASDIATTLDIANAVDHAFSYASTKPCVVNLSMGDNFGPHDGCSPVEEWIDNCIDAPWRAVVVAAGNEGLGKRHASGVVGPGTPVTVFFDVQATQDLGEGDVFSIWYPADCTFEVRLSSPGGTSNWLGATTPANFQSFGSNNDQVKPYQQNRAPWSWGQANEIYLRVKPITPGQWSLTVRAIAGSPEGKFDAWIERQRLDVGDVTPEFSPGSRDPNVTITTPSTGRKTITVGGYITRKPTKVGSAAEGVAIPDVGDLAPTSGRGPTRDGRQKPEVTAPEAMIVSTMSIDDPEQVVGQLQRYWEWAGGTSMAAPHVTGVIALMFQKDFEFAESIRNDPNWITSGKHEPRVEELRIDPDWRVLNWPTPIAVRGKWPIQIRPFSVHHRLDHELIRKIITSTARPPTSGTTGFDPGWGYGRIDAAACLGKVPIKSSLLGDLSDVIKRHVFRRYNRIPLPIPNWLQR